MLFPWKWINGFFKTISKYDLQQEKKKNKRNKEIFQVEDTSNKKEWDKNASTKESKDQLEKLS